MHQNGLSSAYLGFKTCWIQWHLFWVSTISNSWYITLSGKNFTFCWFWVGKMHQNGLSSAYLGFKVCWIQWHLFWVSTISSSWKITILGDTYHKMVVKTMKMGWDVCSSPPWVPFYPYTMFQNPISRPSSKIEENYNNSKHVLITQCSNIVHCDWYTQKPICADIQAFSNFFPVQTDAFLFFVRRS